MTKIWIGFISITILGFVTVFLYNQFSNSESSSKSLSDKQTLAEETSEKSQTNKNQYSDSKNGITATIKDLIIQDGKTIAMLEFDNHVYEISSMDIEKRSSFSNVKPSNYKILSERMGGHHVESLMVFDGELNGKFVIGLNDDLVFNFNIE